MGRPRKKLPPKTFSEVLTFVMEMRGYGSASDLADDTGISGATLSRYLNGKRPKPSAAEIVRLAKVLRFDAEDLLGASAKVVEEPESEQAGGPAPPSSPAQPFGKVRKKAPEPEESGTAKRSPRAPGPTRVDE